MKEIKKYHDGIIAFLVLIIAIIILTVILFKTQPDVYIYISNERDSLHDLLNNQYTTLLTTIGIFVTIFSIAIPLYQRQKIKDEIDELKEIKKDFPKMQEDFEKIKNDFLEKEEKISNIFVALSMAMEDKLDGSVCLFDSIDGVPGNEKRCIEIIYTILSDENNLLFSIINSKSKNNIGQITEKLKDLNEKIKRNSQHEEGVKCILNDLPTEKDFISRQDLADWLGADSPEYKNLVAALSIFYDAYDKQSKDSSEVGS